jgi:hypothetical protein
MAKVHPGATLVPHFRDFLPGWIARQPWYQGIAPEPISAVGFIRFEDPAGEVGLETHLVRCGPRIYQVPMTYRGAPLAGAEAALISTAEHSALGSRWIYDATADPVWVAELIRLIRTGADAAPGAKRGVAFATARGRRSAAPWPEAGEPAVEVRRVLDLGPPVGEDGVLGILEGTWHPDGPDSPATSGALTVLRAKTAGG